MIAGPFSIEWTTRDRMRYIRTRSLAYGLARLEADAPVLQYRVKHRSTQGGVPLPQQPESEIRESRIPFEALRSARLVRGWWRGTRLVLSAADLRPFADLPGAVRDQLSLTTRFLDGPPPDAHRFPSAGGGDGAKSTESPSA